MNAREILDLAWDRYDNDVVFHARVHHATEAVKAEIQSTGMPWSRSFNGVIMAACATALLMAEIHDPVTGEFIELDGEAGCNTLDSEPHAGAESTDAHEFHRRGADEAS